MKRWPKTTKPRQTGCFAELTTQWLENREWPRTDAQIQVARSSLFTARDIVRDMIAAGREKEVEEIRNLISTIVPELKAESLPDESPKSKFKALKIMIHRLSVFHSS